MGCNSSTPKAPPSNVVSKEADEFYKLATTEHHPVAQKLLEEWVQFVDAQVRRNAGDPTAAQAYESRPKEVWADTANRPVTHRSVDYVGKMFLEYIKRDLSQRGWGGNFDYKVAGVAKQGFLKANANIDAANKDVPEEVNWEIKIHYDSSVQGNTYYSEPPLLSVDDRETCNIASPKQTEMPNCHRPCVVLDVREPAQYNDGHVPGAFSFPWSTREQLCAELPPRHVDLRLVSDIPDGERAELRRYFAQMGYRGFTIQSPEEAGCTSRTGPRGFCWCPNPFLERHAASLVPGVALDIGTGAGRDLVFLASRGWAVCGFDNRWHLAARCRTFSDRHAWSSHTGVCVADARRPLPFRRGAFDLVHVCRFIHRPLLPELAAVLRPGGAILYSHFLEGCEHTARGYPKNDSGYFRRGELPSLLEAVSLTVLVAEETTLEDGRPMVHVLAQKRQAAPA